MNYRFLSVVGLAAAMAVTGGCSANKGTTSTAGATAEPLEQAASDTASVPVWAPQKHGFNPSKTRKHDLIHTKLRVSFDWEKQHLKGTAELTLKPYFYPQNTVVLDAKGFDVHNIHLMKGIDGTPLKYTYDGLKLTIDLGRTYTRSEQYILEIIYTAKPNELASSGSEAITSDKGLYFINPLGTEPNKPRQIWTQGETEANSAWFPTIDSPNERMTQEIYITVDSKFTTLSNGTFVYSRKNPDGTKTDYWKQELPHAPYLAMMAIGEFAVVKDKWRNLEVNYYVEPAYAKTAKKIFGHTPEMMEFFSKKLGVDYPWAKYSQVVVRDFVSGAMENTSASTFMEDLQMTERELLDKNWDYIVAHELFHQWFGDYVTTESWANLPLNESFANYSEYLWMEHKYGADEAAYHHLDEMGQYLGEAETKREPLIRYHYADKEDMFDSHSYAKGGRVLHMLRKYVGDDAFFASLNLYLTKNKFSDVEVAELRMAFEDTTGEDLMWFFDQWFMSAGHPSLAVSHAYDNGQLRLRVVQQQDTVYQPVYRLPLKVSVWAGGKRTEFPIEVTKTDETFTFPMATQPQLVLFDGEQQLLGVVDHTKTEQELVYQFYNTKQLLPKLEAITKLSEKLQNAPVQKMMQDALKDEYWFVRSSALDAIGNLEGTAMAPYQEQILQLARQDKKGTVKATAVMMVAQTGGDQYRDLYLQAMRDSSYQVNAAGILAYASATDAPDIAQRLASFENERSEEIVAVLASYYAVRGGPEKNSWFVNQIKQRRGSALYYVLQSYSAFLATNGQAATPEVIALLADLAQNNNLYYVRMGAFQSLMVLSEKPGVQELLNEIRENEKDKRLIEMYKQYQ